MPESTEPITRLLDAMRQGDAAAQGRVLLRYQAWLSVLAKMQIDARLGGKFGASDIVQQTMLEAVRALSHFRGRTEGELLAWLRQVLAHVLAHEVRRYRGAQQRDVAREVSLEQSLAESSLRLRNVLAGTATSPSAQAARGEQEVLLAEVLSRLPEDYRQVIVLRNLQGLSHEEIARRLGRSAGAVRMLWLRALAQLREAMEAAGDRSGR